MAGFFCTHATDPTSDIHWPVRIFYAVLTVLHAVEATSSASHDQGPGLAANWNYHSMRWSVRAEGFLVAGKVAYFIGLQMRVLWW